MISVKVYKDWEGDVCYEYNGLIYPFCGGEVDLCIVEDLIAATCWYYPYALHKIELVFPNGLDNHYIETIEINEEEI